jgi:hypothetical protein
MRVHTMLGVALLVSGLSSSDAQSQERRRSAGGEASTGAAGIPRNARFPYAGLWEGVFTLPEGSDKIGFEFTLVDSTYRGRTIHPGGGGPTHGNLSAGADGLRWEQPNSGGGTWAYHVRLVAPDSIAGTLELKNAPAEFTTAPKGTIAMRRVAPASKTR